MPDEQDRLTRLERWAFGNGTPGADERLRNIEATMRDVRETLEALRKAEKARVHEEHTAKRERRAFYAGIAAVLSLLGVGGWQAVSMLSHRLGQLMQSFGPTPPPGL